MVTMDAAGCQRETAGKTGSKEADCLPAVKGNQGTPESDAERTLRFTEADSDWKEEDFGHGGIESLRCFLYRDLSFTEKAHQWKPLPAAVKMESTRYMKPAGKRESETRCYITGCTGSAEVAGKAVRSRRVLKINSADNWMSLSRKINPVNGKGMPLKTFP